jgi:biotin transport system ATP-binding protein
VLDSLPQRVVIVSHDPAVLERMDRVLWLEGGRVAGDGPAAAVLRDFRAEMTRLGKADADTDLAG